MAEKTIMITGKHYQEIKEQVDNNEPYAYNIGTDGHPQMINITDIYLDTDPDFTRNPRQFAKVSDNLKVQVKIEY